MRTNATIWRQSWWKWDGDRDAGEKKKSLQILGEKEKKDHYLIIMILIPGVHDFPKEPRPNRAPESLSVKNFVT